MKTTKIASHFVITDLDGISIIVTFDSTAKMRKLLDIGTNQYDQLRIIVYSYFGLYSICNKKKLVFITKYNTPKAYFL